MQHGVLHTYYSISLTMYYCIVVYSTLYSLPIGKWNMQSLGLSPPSINLTCIG
jgi:hypothetical protein